MARGRMLRAQISVSPQVNDLSLKSTLLFTWLIPHVDDWGRFYADPRRLKGIIFPIRDDITIKDIRASLIEIKNKGLIFIYDDSGNFREFPGSVGKENLYLSLVNFEKHQQGLHKRASSKFPPPNATSDADSGNFREFPGISGNFPPELEQELEQEQEKTFMSGKPDDAIQKNSEIKKQAEDILNFLNSKTGRCYRPVETNLKLIVARLKSGASVMDCRQVIAKKTREWKGDEKMSEYLRPATLFNATKFEQYIGELIETAGETHVEQN